MTIYPIARKIRIPLGVLTLLASLGLIFLHSPSVIAQANTPSSTISFQAPASDLVPPVLVNGSKVTSKQVDDMVKLAVIKGAKDSVQLRQTLLNDLIVRKIILQEAQRSRLVSQDDNELKIRLATQTAIIDLWFAQYLVAHPIAEDSIKAVYDQNATITKDLKNANEYQLAQIIVATEAQAIEIIKNINNGASFEVLAKEQSLDIASGVQGGFIGWVLPSRLIPSIANVVLVMGKGTVTSTPIAVGGNWVIIKIEDVRTFEFPSYEILKPQIIQELIAKTKQQAVEDLLKTAKIAQGR